MANLLRRLQKLEARVTDRSSGYVPHSEAWFDHWAERLQRFMAGDDADAVNGMPLAFVDESWRVRTGRLCKRGSVLRRLRRPEGQCGNGN